MRRRLKSLIPILAVLALAGSLAACGEEQIEVPQSDPGRSSAELFKQRCAGCHTFSVVGTNGSATDVRTREQTDGPNFDTRHECVERVLYALHNGGFSGAIMPANIVVGEEARDLAQFVARWAGSDAGPRPKSVGDASNGYHCVGGDSGDAGQGEPAGDGDAGQGESAGDAAAGTG